MSSAEFMDRVRRAVVTHRAVLNRLEPESPCVQCRGSLVEGRCLACDPIPPATFRLCYVEEAWAWFTTAMIVRQWGDDWNDAPYEHNAGRPYPWRPAMAEPAFYLNGGMREPLDQYWLCRRAWHGDLETPADRDGGAHSNSRWSVQAINRGETPWLRTSRWSSLPAAQHVSIFANCSLVEFEQQVIRSGGMVYAPIEGGQP